MACRSTWQVAFGLETQVKDPKPCLKQTLKGKLTEEQQPEVMFTLARLSLEAFSTRN